MVVFRVASVQDVAAHALLTNYFADRAASFPAEMGEYRTTFPDPAQFVPPRGVFLVLEQPDAPEQPGQLKQPGSLDELDLPEEPDSAVSNATPVGCGGIRMLAHAAGVTRFEIKHVWIEPDARGAGLGQLLIDELEVRARAFGASEIVLDTNASQAAASRLYRRNGYSEIRPYNDNPNATLWFAKNLTTELE